MAMRNLQVIITVTDKASKPLDDVAKKVRGTGKAAAESEVDFTKFNRTLFTTAAFVGTFSKMFSTLTSAFDQGSQLDRLSNQFERVLGPKGQLFQNLSQLTDTSIDKYEAMRQGISLKSLGIVKSSEHLAEILAKSGVAAKMAGHDSAEGVKNFSEFLKDGNVSHLQFLNLIAQTNPGLQAQMAILSKVGGVMGNVVSTQARLAIGMSLLNKATNGNLKGFRDLRDSVLDIKTNFKLFKDEMGRFLLTALQPLVDKFSLFLLKTSLFIENTLKADKNLVFLAKTVVVATGAVLGLAGALGTLRLATMALNSIGFGLPKLLATILLLGTGFLGITSKVDKFTDKLKVFGAFVKGVYQLVTSLNTKTGIAQIDEDLKELLEKNGIFVFAQNVSRAISVVRAVIKDMVDSFKWAARSIDNLFGGLGRKFIDTISKFKEPWENWWVNESATPIEKFMRSFTVIGSTLGATFAGMVIKGVLGKLGGSLLSKIPIIGGLFGGGGRGGGPKGTKSDPIYTRDSNSVGSTVNFLSNFLGKGNLLQGLSFGNILLKLKDGILGATTLFNIFRTLGLKEAFIALRSLVNGVVGRFVAVGIAIAAVTGAFQGILNRSEEYTKFLVGVIDITKALFNVFYNFVKNSEILQTTFSVIKTILIDWPLTILDKIREGWMYIFEIIGDWLGPLGEKFSKKARELAPDSFQKEVSYSPLMETKQDYSNLLGTSILPSTASTSGDKTDSVSIPTDHTADADTMDFLGEQLKTVSGAQRKQMQMSVENALRSDSAGGSAITAEEMADIIKFSKDKQEDLLSKIEANTRRTSAPNNISRRGQ